MYMIILLANLVLANAVPNRNDNNQENNDYSPPESQSEQTLSQLRTLFRKDLHQAALYSEEEIKEYLGNSGDSVPHVSDSMLKTQQQDGRRDSAWKDSPGAGDSKEHDGAAADAEDVSAPEAYNQGLKSPVLDEKQDRDSGFGDTRDPFLADQGDNSEDPTAVQMSKPADSNKDKITISIDAVRIRNENERKGMFGQVNDQRDNAIAYPRHWGNSERNSYFRGRTRSSSSPSAEALAMLTQKLSKLEVEVGRLKEVVLLQGAVHIKTSERIEMMLLTQGKLAVKNDLDTRKVLKRVKRCCSCSGGGKARRALRRARKGPTHAKSNKEKPTPETSDSSPALSISYPEINRNVEERNRQNNGNSDQPQVVERRQSDSHSQNQNPPKLQRDHRDDESSREHEKHGAESDQSRKIVSVLPQHNRALENSTSGFRPFSQQATKSQTALGNQPEGNMTSNGRAITPDDGNQKVQVAHQSGDQEDRYRQVTTPSRILSTTEAHKSVENLTPETANSYEDKISSDSFSTVTTIKPSSLSTLAKQSPIISTVTQKTVHTARNTPAWSQPAEAMTGLKKSIANSENDSLSPELNESKNQYTQNPVLEKQTDPPILDVTKLHDEKVVIGSNERQAKVTEEHQRRESDNILDPVANTTQHMTLTTQTTTIMSTAVIDGSSEDEQADKHNVSSAKHPTPESTLDSGRYHTSPFPPHKVRNDINTPYSAVSSIVNATSSSELPHETEIAYSPAGRNSDGANVRQHSISDKTNLNKNDSHNNHQDGDQLSTNGYRVKPTPSEENANLRAESQTSEQSSNPVLSMSSQQPTKSSLYSNQKNGERSTKAEQRIPDTSYTHDLLERSTTTFDTTTTQATQASSSITTSPLSKPSPQASSNYEHEEMTKAAEDVEYRTLSTVTKGGAEHKGVEVNYQSSSSTPVTTTLSRRSTTLSSILSTPTTMTSTSTSAKLPPSSSSTSTSIQTSERQPTKVSSSPSSTASAESPNTTISVTQTQTARTTAAASTTTKTTTNIPSTTRKSTQTTATTIAETTPMTTIPTTTQQGEPELAVDLSTGQIRNDNLPGVTWVVYPSYSRPAKRKRSALAASDSRGLSRHCSIQGVLKFTFTPPSSSSRRRLRPSRGRNRQGHRPGDDGDGEGGDSDAGGERRRLLLEMEFRRPHRWVFNVGDSRANNGFSGDGSVQENDCEAQGYGQSFAVYASDKHTNSRQKLLKSFSNFIHDKLTLVISDQSIVWDNHRGHADNLTDASLFALSGQYDRQGPVNYDVYLGLNRVIAGQYRRGHGLCRVTARWLKEG